MLENPLYRPAEGASCLRKKIQRILRQEYSRIVSNGDKSRAGRPVLGWRTFEALTGPPGRGLQDMPTDR